MTIITEQNTEKRKVMTEKPAVRMSYRSPIKVEYDIYPDMIHVYQTSPESNERRTVALIPTNNELEGDKSFMEDALKTRLDIVVMSINDLLNRFRIKI